MFEAPPRKQQYPPPAPPNEAVLKKIYEKNIFVL